MIQTCFLPSLRLLLLMAVALSAGVLSSPGHADAQTSAPPAFETGPRRVEATPDDRLELSRPMRRARRTLITGASMFAVGGVGLIGSAVVLARLDDRSCASHDPFCENGWTKAMGSLTGMVVGTALIASGVVTFGIGIARRNRLLRISDLAVGAGTSRLELSFHF